MVSTLCWGDCWRSSKRYHKNQRSSRGHTELSQLAECVPNKRARRANMSPSHAAKKQRMSRGTKAAIKRSFAVQFEDTEPANSHSKHHRGYSSPVREPTR